MARSPKFDGPIPGENFTSDTKNYPWHRPPDKVDLDEIIEKMIESFDDPEKASVYLSVLESGDSILDFVTGTLRIAVGEGKMPIDAAILVAGPTAMMAELVAEKAGIDYERGFDPKPRIITSERLRAYGSEEAAQEPETGPTTPPAPEEPKGPPAPAAGGLMGAPAPTPGDQAAMLGQME